MADETRIQVLKEKGREAETDSFMWLFRSGEDGRCSFSNNLSENAIRPFTVGRKNWLFSDTPKGASASATVYTMVEMAKVNNLNVYKYLNYLLENHPTVQSEDADLARLTPWSEEVIEQCAME